MGGVETSRWVARVTALSGVNAEDNLKECPRGARMALKDYSDNEAVRSRGQDLVSTPFSLFFVGAMYFVTSANICTMMTEVSSEQLRSQFHVHTEC